MADHASDSFVEAFAPLAHHVFPDGCPSGSLADIWPIRGDRSSIPAQSAFESIDRVHRYAQTRRLDREQLSAVVTVACASLDPTVASPLMDGTSQTLVGLVRCLLPRDDMPWSIVRRLLSVLNRLDDRGRCKVLQWVYLTCASGEIRQRLSSLSALLVARALQPTTAGDAVRLLARLDPPSPAPLARLRACLEDWRRSKVSKEAKRALERLLEYYQHEPSSGQDDWLAFPDHEWQQEYSGKRTRLGVSVTRLRQPVGDWSSVEELLRGDMRFHAVLGTDREMNRLQANLGPMLQQAWYRLDDLKTGSVGGEADDMTGLLAVLVDFAAATGSLPKRAQDFVLGEVLPMWDGGDERVGDLITFIDPCAVGVLRRRVLTFLEPLVLYGNAVVQCRILQALARLLLNWMDREWVEELADAKLRIICQIIQWTDDLIVKAMLINASELVRIGAADFFASLSVTMLRHIVFLALPSPGVCYRILLSRSAAPVDRLCRMLDSYRAVLIKLRAGDMESADDSISVAQRIKVFNCYLWDVASVLWSGAPLPRPKSDRQSKGTRRSLSILYTDVRPSTHQQLFPVSDIVSQHLLVTEAANFAGFAVAFAGDSPRISAQSKVAYLEYLKQRGMTGLYSFLRTSFASLTDRKEEVSDDG